MPALLLLYALDSIPVEAKVTLKVGLLVASKGQQSAYYDLAAQFEARYPDITVNYILHDDAGYKRALKRWFVSGSGPDVLYWQAGERLKQFARQGLLESLETVWHNEKMDNYLSEEVKKSVSYKGGVIAFPYAYYPWGFYYKKSLFYQFGLRPPETWKDFLAVCDTFKSKGISPIVIGTKHHWPAAAWFDYLNLRINGLAYHQQLMDGDIPYTDVGVRQVFQTWKVLVDQGYFVESPERLSWKEGLPYLYRDKAGMTLIGNFVGKHLQEPFVDDIGFFKFPSINMNLPAYEEAPMEVFVIPRYATQKTAAKMFLAFVGQAEVQSRLNRGLGYIPPHKQAALAGDNFIQAGARVLREAKGFSQFYDRDTRKEMAMAGIQIFSAFIQSGDISAAVRALEEKRKDVFELESTEAN